MKKGFTFSQLAVILIVVLGLVVAVVLAATQFSNTGSKLAEVGSQVTGQDLTINAGTKCFTNGGQCLVKKNDSSTCSGLQAEYAGYSSVSAGTDCGTNKLCCKK